MKASSHKDLIVWQRAMDLAVEIYHLTERFPRQEIYGLTAQMRRAAVSIPSNIAEGRRRATRADYGRFLQIAFGSAAELETQIDLAARIRCCSREESTRANGLLGEVLRMLNVMIERL